VGQCPGQNPIDVKSDEAIQIYPLFLLVLFLLIETNFIVDKLIFARLLVIVDRKLILGALVLEVQLQRSFGTL